jgi:hypothetical protein
MAEVEGIDMFIVFADVLGDGSDGGARSDIGSMISSPFTSSPSVYIGSRPSSAPAQTMSRSTPGPAASRSARTGGRSGQEVWKNALRICWTHFVNPTYFSLISDRDTQAEGFVHPTLPELHKPKGMRNLRSLLNYPRPKEFSGENL